MDVIVTIGMDRHVGPAESSYAAADVLKRRKVSWTKVIDLSTAADEAAVRTVVREYSSTVRPSRSGTESKRTWTELVASSIGSEANYGVGRTCDGDAERVARRDSRKPHARTSGKIRPTSSRETVQVLDTNGHRRGVTTIGNGPACVNRVVHSITHETVEGLSSLLTELLGVLQKEILNCHNAGRHVHISGT